MAKSEPVPYSVPWLVAEHKAWVAEGIAAAEELLAKHAAFQRYCEERDA